MNLVHEKFTETEYRKFNIVSDETQMLLVMFGLFTIMLMVFILLRD